MKLVKNQIAIIKTCFVAIVLSLPTVVYGENIDVYNRADTGCPVTLPNVNESYGFYGNEYLQVSVPKNGIYNNRPIEPHSDFGDAQGIRQKFAWKQFITGDLTVSAVREDGDSSSPMISVPTGYSHDYIPTLIIFPTPGCWKITGAIEEKSLEFWVQILEPDVN